METAGWAGKVSTGRAPPRLWVLCDIDFLLKEKAILDVRPSGKHPGTDDDDDHGGAPSPPGGAKGSQMMLLDPAGEYYLHPGPLRRAPLAPKSVMTGDDLSRCGPSCALLSR